jgi:hypothetical protein
MLNQGVFDPGFSGNQRALALAGAQQLGYEFYVTNVILPDVSPSGPLNPTIGIVNTGVAPFYYDWPMQLAVLNTTNALAQSWTTPWRLSSLLPGVNTVWTYTQSNPALAVGQYKLLVGVPNPMTNGPPLRFANQTQDADLPGWLTLGQFSVLPAPPTLSASSFGGLFLLQVSGAAPATWTVEGTSNFLTWLPLATNHTSASQWTFSHAISWPERFYRVVIQP